MGIIYNLELHFFFLILMYSSVLLKNLCDGVESGPSAASKVSGMLRCPCLFVYWRESVIKWLIESSVP